MEKAENKEFKKTQKENTEEKTSEKFSEKRKDKMQRFNFPEHGFVIEAKNIREAEKKAKEKLISKK